MREILFRGKDDESGKFVYGYYGLERDMRYEGDFLLKPAITWEENGVMMHSFVIPETVGQYTGLTDKNGTKIFEGDIVKHSQQYLSGTVISVGVVKFYKSYCGWLISDSTNGRANMFLVNQHTSVEVIGNIYDNPELLKGAE